MRRICDSFLVIGVDAGQVHGSSNIKRNRSRRQYRLEHPRSAANKIDHLEPLGEILIRPASIFGQIEQVVDHFRQLGSAELRMNFTCFSCSAVSGPSILSSMIREAADRAQRRAEFVAHVGEETALKLGAPSRRASA